VRKIDTGDLPKSLPAAPFEVPDFDGMYVQCPSPHIGHVLTIERQLYNWGIFEYDTPLTRGRQWTYDDEANGGSTNALVIALSSLLGYIDPPGPDYYPAEPKNWTRAIDFVDHQTRVRRRRLEPDGSFAIYDTSDEEL